jgi:hypothetical protein
MLLQARELAVVAVALCVAADELSGKHEATPPVASLRRRRRQGDVDDCGHGGAASEHVAAVRRGCVRGWCRCEGREAAKKRTCRETPISPPKPAPACLVVVHRHIQHPY